MYDEAKKQGQEWKERAKNTENEWKVRVGELKERVKNAENELKERVKNAENELKERVKNAEGQGDKRVKDLKAEFNARETLWAKETARLELKILKNKHKLLRVEASKCALTFDRSFVESTSWTFAASNPGKKIANVTEGFKAFVNAHVLEGNKLRKAARKTFNKLGSKKGFSGITEQSRIVKELQDIYHVTSKDIHYQTNPKLALGIYAGAGNPVTRAAIGVFIAASQQMGIQVR
jgi:hypothetical protein